MQLLPCPFCGDRDEREFFFAGELGKERPDTTCDVSDEDWAAYLHARRNQKGAVREVWIHLTCSEVFGLERNNTTMTVTKAIPFRKEPA